MIDFVRGTVAEITENSATIDVNGVGYLCNVPTTMMASLCVGQHNTLLYTALILTDGDISLYGFQTPDERDLFRLLITVSGIGPKAGLKLLCLSKKRLLSAIASEEAGVLTTVPGIGKITAKRVILELRDKLGRWMQETYLPPDVSDMSGEVEVAARGLQSLGYSSGEIRTMMHRFGKGDLEGKSAQEIIRMCLKKK